MKVVYDETKAIATKQEIDVKANEEKQYENYYLLLRIVTAGIFLFGYVAFLIWGSTISEAVPALSIIVPVFCLGGIVFAFCTIRVQSAEERYPPAVQYHTAIQGKKVLSVDWRCITPNYLSDSPLQDYMVGVTLEDADHIVTRESITVRDCTVKIRTDISDTTLDLDERIFYSRYTA